MSCEVSNGKCRCPDDAKVISSFLTSIYKFIFPTVWIGGFGFFALSLHASKHAYWPLALIAWIVSSLAIYWGFIRLKWVAIDEENIYISNFIKMISVPLADIEEIEEHFLLGEHPVSITFSRKTEFRRKIIFMPKFYLGCAFFMSHPPVEDLRVLVEERKEKKE